MLNSEDNLMKEIEILNEMLDDHVGIDEFESIVEELEDQATLNEELDRANRYFIEESIRLKRKNEKLKKKVEELERVNQENWLEQEYNRMSERQRRKEEESQQAKMKEWEEKFEDVENGLVVERKKNIWLME